MRQLVALAWKEWHEVRIYLWIALGVFIGLPLIGVLEAMYQHTGHHFEIEISPWVIIFGGVLAVFVAVGATCRDLSGRLEDFWRSRPLNVARWLLVKYFVGLTVVLLSCLLPLAVELWFQSAQAIASPCRLVPVFMGNGLQHRLLSRLRASTNRTRRHAGPGRDAPGLVSPTRVAAAAMDECGGDV